MNERDDELREQAWTLISNEERTQGELYETRERWKKCDQMFADLIRADEREACADIVENADTPDCGGWTSGGISNAIRARGNK